jgi:Fe2+ transport system protein FeoA
VTGPCPQPDGPAMPLTSMPVNATAHVCETCMDPRDAAMLRAMGMRPCSRVRMIRTGEPCIVEVLGVNPATGACGCRIGLAHDMAARVTVRLATKAPA